jgi:hypothetical protein
MSRSRKRHAIVKDHPKDAKKINNRLFRAKTKQAIKEGKEPPLKNSEVMQDYNVSDWVFVAKTKKDKIKFKRK